MCAQIILFCFAAGQLLIYAHQHHTRSHIIEIAKKPCSHIIKERCDLCDAMQHTAMLLGIQPQLPQLTSSSYRHFVAGQPHFTPIGLILASGRAPPLV